jgi:hypothetical protein
VAAFRGITGVENVEFEFDGPNLIQNLGYDQARLLRIADEVIAQGAGLKCANYSYYELPSTYPILGRFAAKTGSAELTTATPAREQTVLLFLSKWTNYCYRERTEWVHDAQFGAWRMLTAHGMPVRIICEDNLDEDLSRYRGLYVAFSPPELIPPSSRAKLEALEGRAPSVVEITHAPPRPPTAHDGPLAYRWLKGDAATRAAAERELAGLLVRFK